MPFETKRKMILIGGSYGVTLPKEWAKNLKKDSNDIEFDILFGEYFGMLIPTGNHDKVDRMARLIALLKYVTEKLEKEKRDAEHEIR